jgi:hypothetical protein
MFKRLFVLVCFAVAAVYGQATTVTPDCVIPFQFTAVAQATPNLTCGHNNTVGVFEWHVLYFNFGFGALSLAVQSAPDNGGVPGTWVNFAGTIDAGVNPNTAITQADTRMHGFFPWNRVRLNSATGTGTVQGVLYGCRAPGCSALQNLSGAVSSVNLAQIGGFTVVMGGVNGSLGVGGLAANGAAVAGRPVLVAGSDGTNARTLATDTSGRQVEVGAAANGAAVAGNPVRVAGSDGTNARDLAVNTAGQLIDANGAVANGDGVSNTNQTEQGTGGATLYYRVLPYAFNGAAFDRSFVCPSSAVFNITTSGDHQIIAASGTTKIYICDVSYSADNPSDFKLDTGTGADCVTGTAAITGNYKAVLTLEVPYAGQLRTAASQALCVNFGSSVNVGGTVTYAQF